MNNIGFINKINNIFNNEPDKELIRYMGRELDVSYSYKNIHDMSAALLYCLQSKGIKCGDHVAYVSSLSPYSIAAVLCCIYGGFVFVPIDPSLSPEQICEFINNSDCSAVISNAELYEKVSDADSIILLEENSKNEASEEISYCQEEIETMAIIFSAGTTGTPKMVMVGYSQQYTATQIQQCVWNDRMRYLFCFPIFHISGYSTFLGNLINGGCFGMVEKVDSENLQIGFASFKPILFGMVPQVYDAFKGKIEQRLNSRIIKTMMKTCGSIRAKTDLNLGKVIFKKVNKLAFGGDLVMTGSGGGLLDKDTYKFFYDLGYEWVNIYASTELNIPISTTFLGQNYPYCSVGKADSFKNIDIRIHSPDKNGSGEIYVRSDISMLGYYKDTKATKEAYNGQYFKTGDIGFIDKKGYLRITGRAKESILLKTGEKISPEGLEKDISKFLSADFAVCGIPNSDNYDNIYLFIGGSPLPEHSKSLDRYVRSTSKNYHIDKTVYIDKIPRSSIGKVKRMELKEKYSHIGNNLTDKSIRWSNLIPYIVSEYELNDDLASYDVFQLGLDSIDVINIISELESKYDLAPLPDFDWKCPIKDIREHLIEKKNKIPQKRNNGKLLYRFLRKCLILPVRIKYNPIIIDHNQTIPDKIIIAPNHRKTPDSLVLASIIKNTVHWAALKRFFTGEDSIFNNNKNVILRKITKFIFNNAGMIPIDRNDSNIKSLNAMKEYLSDNAAIGIFPEGTTNKNPDQYRLGDVKAGAFDIAKISETDILPVGVVWKNNRVAVCFGQIINIGNYGNVDDIKKAWINNTTNAIMKCEDALKWRK